MTTLTVTVPDMACSACVNTITQAVQALDATATVQADVTAKTVAIEAQAEAEALTQAIVQAGYTVA